MRAFRSIRTLLLASLMIAAPMASFAGVFFSVSFGPPELPVYEQPLCPGDGYIWTPGYWSYDQDGGYYWVPGTWVMAPQVGYLWTPGYWGWGGEAFIFHSGYWGPHIGFYGGVNYGFGYGGVGYEGGYWNHDHFAYNRSVNNITNVHVTNVYNRTVINNTTVNRVSYNGGTGGVGARPTQQEMAAEHEQHVQPTPVQAQHEHAAATNKEQFASVNHGRPAIAATPKPGVFRGEGVVQAKNAPSATIGNHGNAQNGNFNGNRPGQSNVNAGRPLVTAHPNGNATTGNRPAYQGNASTNNRTVPNNNADRSNMDRTNANRPNENSNGSRNGYNGNSSRPLVTPHPENTTNGQQQHNAPRPQTSRDTSPQYNAPRQNAPQPQYQNAPRETAPEYNAPRQNAPQPQHQNAPRETAPQSRPAPRPEAAPRQQAEPHGGGEKEKGPRGLR